MAKPLVTLALLALAGTAAAQSGEERLRAQLRATTTELRSAQDQLSSLRAENEALKAAPPAAAKPAEADARALRGAESRAAAATAEAAALRAELDAGRAALAKWQQAYEEAAEAARSRDGELRRLSELNATATGYGKDCASRNRSLVEISQALLVRYRDKGVLSALAAAEPLTGLARVELETAVQEYGGRIADARLPPEPDAAPVDAPPPPAAP